MRDFSFVQDNMTAFINQYIIMLAKYKTDILTKRLTEITFKIYTFYIVKLKINTTLIMVWIEQ